MGAACGELNRFGPDGMAQPLSDIKGDGAVCAIECQQEFLSADPRQKIGVLRMGREAARDGGQNLIARGMAKAVIDLFEMVQIQHHHRQARTALPHFFKVMHGVSAVMQACEAIGHRHFKPFLNACLQTVGLALASELMRNPQNQFIAIQRMIKDIARAKIKRHGRALRVPFGQQDYGLCRTAMPA